MQIIIPLVCGTKNMELVARLAQYWYLAGKCLKYIDEHGNKHATQEHFIEEDIEEIKDFLFHINAGVSDSKDTIEFEAGENGETAYLWFVDAAKCRRTLSDLKSGLFNAMIAIEESEKDLPYHWYKGANNECVVRMRGYSDVFEDIEYIEYDDEDEQNRFNEDSLIIAQSKRNCLHLGLVDIRRAPDDMPKMFEVEYLDPKN